MSDRPFAIGNQTHAQGRADADGLGKPESPGAAGVAREAAAARRLVRPWPHKGNQCRTRVLGHEIIPATPAATAGLI